MKFARKILQKEWSNFHKDQDTVIARNTRRVSGTLRNEHNNRRYSLSAQGNKVTATLSHPDYERYLDMKKTKVRTTRVMRYFNDINHMVRRKGRNIHNKVIFARITPLSFRLLNEMKVEVKESIRSNFSG